VISWFQAFAFKWVSLCRYAAHHHRSNKKVGEDTILQFHKDHPTKAPLLGSSSEEDEDGDGGKASKNWIGVCNARLQHRVWWGGDCTTCIQFTHIARPI
jgi:hypothetical protein